MKMIYKTADYINSDLSNKQFELICDKTTAYDIMNKLDDLVIFEEIRSIINYIQK